MEIFRQLVEGVRHIHSQGLLHRDLKVKWGLVERHSVVMHVPSITSCWETERNTHGYLFPTESVLQRLVRVELEGRSAKRRALALDWTDVQSWRGGFILQSLLPNLMDVTDPSRSPNNEDRLFTFLILPRLMLNWGDCFCECFILILRIYKTTLPWDFSEACVWLCNSDENLVMLWLFFCEQTLGIFLWCWSHINCPYLATPLFSSELNIEGKPERGIQLKVLVKICFSSVVDFGSVIGHSIKMMAPDHKSANVWSACESLF